MFSLLLALACAGGHDGGDGGDGSGGDAGTVSTSSDGKQDAASGSADDEPQIVTAAPIDPTWHTKMWMIAPDNTGTVSEFGFSVSIYGYTIIAGAPGDKGKGTAFIYKWKDDAIVQESQLFSWDNVGGRFGHSVAISDGNGFYIAVVGAPYNNLTGAAYVFTRSGNPFLWTQQQKLAPADGVREGNFGRSVAVYNNLMAVSAPYDDDKGTHSGSVYTYRMENGIWVATNKLTAADGEPYRYYGTSISMHDEYLAVGVPYENDMGERSGSVYLYHYSRASNTWNYMTKIVAGDGMTKDYFGQAVSIYKLEGLYAEEVAVGCPNDTDMGTGAGSVYIYTDSGRWNLSRKLFPGNVAVNEMAGSSVSFNKNMLVMGSSGERQGYGFGAAYIFKRSGYNNSKWEEAARLTSPQRVMGAQYGFSVAVNNLNNMIAIGAPGEYPKGADSGALYVYYQKPPPLGANIRSMLGRRTTLFIAIGAGVLAIGIIGAVAVIRRRRKSA